MIRTVRAIATVPLAALAVVVLGDALLQRAIPLLPPQLEIEDGVAELQRTDPDTLILGSSQARSFDVVRQEVRARTGSSDRINLISLEGGGYTAFRWLLQNRVIPLLDERDSSGALRRTRLARFLFVTEWWDLCGPELPPSIPGRAWTLGDYLADVSLHGINSFNDNYVSWQVQKVFSRSLLVHDRGVGRVLNWFRSLRPDSAADYDRYYLANWQRRVEQGFELEECHTNQQREALRDIFQFARDRNLDLTVLLFPQRPGTITDAARLGPLRRFAEEIRADSREWGFHLVDYTSASPVGDDDFTADFEHILPSSYRKLQLWALSRDLAYLLTPTSSGKEVSRP